MKYDIIIIGAGPGGYEMALEASKHNQKVLLIESNKIGGTCLNAGCIPTKTLYKNAKLLYQLKNINNFGINIDSFSFDYSKVLSQKNEVIKRLQEGINFLLQKANIDLIYGKAIITSHNTITVNNEEYEGNYIVIATGSKPISLPSFEEAIYAEDLLDFTKIPESLSIIGGGVIGIEMATIFNQFGTKVQIFEMSDRLLPQADLEISKRISSFLRNEGIGVYVNARAEKFQNKILTVSIRNIIQTFETENVLVAVGRKPNIDVKSLDDLGIKYNNKGIIVNDNFQTSINNIYAIGDVCGKNMLAHYATYSGKKALNHILGKNSNINFDLVPSVVFTFPEISWVGLTEEKCKSLNINYQVYKSLYRANGKALADHEIDGFVKIIVINDYI